MRITKRGTIHLIAWPAAAVILGQAYTQQLRVANLKLAYTTGDTVISCDANGKINGRGVVAQTAYRLEKPFPSFAFVAEMISGGEYRVDVRWNTRIARAGAVGLLEHHITEPMQPDQLKALADNCRKKAGGVMPEA